MNEHAKTIGLGAILLAIIFFGRAIDGANAEPAVPISERITMSSVAHVMQPIPITQPEVMPAIAANIIRSDASHAPANGPPSVDADVNAVAGAIVGLNSGAVLWERRPFQRHPLASLTKLMTAVIALEHIGPDKTVTIADEDILAEGDAGALKSGETFSVRDLIAAMLLASSNDAADALARFYGVKSFVDAMQRKAVEYELIDTSFFDPSGLSPLNQSTVHDTAALVRGIAREHPEIFALSAQKETVIMERNSGTSRIIKSINAFAGQPDFLGGKTGYTPEAHGNLISLFRRAWDDVLIIVLGTDDRFGDTRTLRSWSETVHF